MTGDERIDYAQLTLHAAYTLGGHWLLCNHNKHPLRGAWQKVPADLDELYEHVASGAGLPGVIPHSLGYTVLDCDKGPANRRAACLYIAPPALVTASGTPPNQHWWYPDTERRANRRWEVRPTAGGTLTREESDPHTVSGEVRGSNGYVIFWPDAAEQFNLNMFRPDCVTYAQACDILWLDAGAAQATDVREIVNPANWTRGNAPAPAPEGWQRGYHEAARLTEQLHHGNHGYSPDDYTDWTSVGMAMHQAAAEGRIDAGQAFEEWVKWSAGSSKFQSDADCWAHWRSFGNPAGRPITAASLFRR